MLYELAVPTLTGTYYVGCHLSITETRSGQTTILYSGDQEVTFTGSGDSTQFDLSMVAERQMEIFHADYNASMRLQMTIEYMTLTPDNFTWNAESPQNG